MTESFLTKAREDLAMQMGVQDSEDVESGAACGRPKPSRGIGTTKMKNLLRNLKSLEDALLREVEELQVVLAQKVAEVEDIRRKIELQNHPIPNAAEAPSRPTTEKAGSDPVRASLPNLIEEVLRDNKDGVSLIDLVHRIAEVRGGTSKNLRGMVDQAIYRLKQQDRISRNPENMKFFIK